jgi:membrane-bound metal-dependent hydrolase YbcI (DUF457 family)
MIAGWTAGGRPARGWIRSALLLAVIAVLPDVDLLWGGHHQATHSVLAVVAIRGLTPFFARTVLAKNGVRPLGIAAAYASHILLDLIGADSTPPIGVMLFWPFSREYFIAPWTPFRAISRRYWLPGFWAHTLGAVGFEIVVLTPLLIAVWWIRRSVNGAALRRTISRGAAG